MVLNENRIRDLSKESFRKYTDLRYLYLHENMIQTVEIGTFTQLNYLEVLDLSSNALTTLPLELFHLSTLRTLYAADNNLFQLAGHLEVHISLFVDVCTFQHLLVRIVHLPIFF